MNKLKDLTRPSRPRFAPREATQGGGYPPPSVGEGGGRAGPSSAASLLEAFPTPVVVFDPETWRPIDFNGCAANLMGYAPAEFGRLTISDLEATPAPHETIDHVERIRHTGGDTFVRLHRKKDGTPIRVLISVRWTEWLGRPGLFTAWHDVAQLAPGGLAGPSPAIPERTIVWADPVMGALLSLVHRVAQTDVTVLITGESGTGKELVARLIHARGARSTAPFVAVNCAALPTELAESELFGHERGAFSGALTRHRGSFLQAHGGTLFLDEIGELPALLQAKLLRVLEGKEITLLGAEKARPLDVRVLAATNRDPASIVTGGHLRKDLYHRLASFPIHIPPLRERLGDIPALANHYLLLFASQFGRTPLQADRAFLEGLSTHTWPGNVRELENVLRQAVLLSDGARLELPLSLRAAVDRIDPAPSLDTRDLQVWMKQHIHGALETCSWRVEGSGGAAHQLGMKPSTLRYRMRKLGLSNPQRSDAR